MGLEAGWNCHICLRSEHSTDVAAAAAAGLPAPGATDVSQGYASMLGSIRIESVPDLTAPGRQVTQKKRPNFETV